MIDILSSSPTIIFDNKEEVVEFIAKEFPYEIILTGDMDDELYEAMNDEGLNPDDEDAVKEFISDNPFFLNSSAVDAESIIYSAMDSEVLIHLPDSNKYLFIYWRR